MVLHNAHVIEHLQGARAWHDGTLEADHWAALGHILPIDAAMLLCRFNPNEDSYDDARQTTTDELGPDYLVRLAQRLVDIDKADRKPRTLRDWHQTARDFGLTYHSWIDAYMEATRPPAPPVVDTPPPEPQSETKEERQDRRLQACIDSGLAMLTKPASLRLPDGVGRLADIEGVTRQSFSYDVKAAQKRRANAVRDGRQ